MVKFMYYSEAIKKMNAGHIVARLGWEPGEELSIIPEINLNLEVHKIDQPFIKSAAKENEGRVRILPYYVFKTKDKDIQLGWMPKPSDEVAGDWYVKERNQNGTKGI